MRGGAVPISARPPLPVVPLAATSGASHVPRLSWFKLGWFKPTQAPWFKPASSFFMRCEKSGTVERLKFAVRVRTASYGE